MPLLAEARFLPFSHHFHTIFLPFFFSALSSGLLAGQQLTDFEHFRPRACSVSLRLAMSEGKNSVFLKKNIGFLISGKKKM